MLFIYALLGKIGLALVLGNPAGIGIALVLLFFLGRAVQGTFVYHAIRRRNDPACDPPRKRWALLLGIPAGTLVLLLGVVLLAEILAVPPGFVVPGTEMQQAEQDLLRAHGVLHPDERVVYFYSISPSSVLDEGNLLTDQRVVSYERADGELYVFESSFEDIERVEVLDKGGILDHAVIEVSRNDGEGFRLYLSGKKEQDRMFLEALSSRIGTSAETSRPSAAPAATER